MKSERAWSIAALSVAVVSVAGTGAGLVANSPAQHHAAYWVGYGLIEVASWMLLVAMWTARRAAIKREQKIAQARVIVREVRAEGDRLHHRHRGLVEAWRDTLDRLNHPPFKPETGNWALTQQGDRFSDVLARVREIEAHVEDWIEDD